MTVRSAVQARVGPFTAEKLALRQWGLQAEAPCVGSLRWCALRGISQVRCEQAAAVADMAAKRHQGDSNLLQAEPDGFRVHLLSCSDAWLCLQC